MPDNLNSLLSQEFEGQIAMNEDFYLRIKVIPNAAKNELKAKMADDTWKIAIAAAPEKGRANQELIKFLAKLLRIDKVSISIISGHADRLKLLKIKKALRG